MKAVFLWLLCFVLLPANSQTTKYTGGTMEFTQNGITKPYGKNVTIVYDSFFKSYEVSYTDVRGNRKKMLFEYKSQDCDCYSYNGIEYHVMAPEISLGYASDGNGFLTFSDVRKTSYGGTRTSYSIKNLRLDK